MEGKKSNYMPIGKRTRLQISLRQKEISDKNKRARWTRSYDEKNNQYSVSDSDDEDIKVVDEAEYLRRMAMYECSVETVDSSSVAGDYRETSDESIQFVSDRCNPFNVGGDDEDQHESCSDLDKDQHSLEIKCSSEVKAGVGSYEGDGSGRDVASFDAFKEAGEGKTKTINEVVSANFIQNKTHESFSDLDEDHQSLRMKRGSESMGEVSGSKGDGSGRDGVSLDACKEAGQAKQKTINEEEVVSANVTQHKTRDICSDLDEEQQCLGTDCNSEAKVGVDGSEGDGSGRLDASKEADEGKRQTINEEEVVSVNVSQNKMHEICSDLDEEQQCMGTERSSEAKAGVDGSEGDGSGRDGGRLDASKEADEGKQQFINEEEVVSVNVSQNKTHENCSDLDEEQQCMGMERSSEAKAGVDGSEGDGRGRDGGRLDAFAESGEGKRTPINGEEVVSVNVSQNKTHENTPDEENLKEVEHDEKYLRRLFKSGEPEEFSSYESESASLSSSSPSSSDSDSSEISIDAKRHSPPMSRNPGMPENVWKRKRGRPPKINNEAVNNATPQTKNRIRKLSIREAENIMLNTILEKVNAGLDSCTTTSAVVTPLCETSTILTLKLRIGVQSSLPENLEEVQDSAHLFHDLGFDLGPSEFGAEASFPNEIDDVHGNNTVTREQLCSEGKHYLIHEDEIGVRCKYCSFLKLEIGHVTPAFSKDPFGIRESRNDGRVPCHNASVRNTFNLPEFDNNQPTACPNNVEGTVWELIRGTKETLYPHQQEGFEFIWRNVGGGIKLDELGKPSKFGSGGCIICHAPGTGKTRLSITFLQSFIRQYPMSKPVIIAPKSMLLTWEEEFARWGMDIPLINMNRPELSLNEACDVLEHAEDVKSSKAVRIAKLYTWAMGKGILGISYKLFAQLAGDRKGVNKKIRRTLLEQPGIVILDEGHIARNDQSNIWNVLTEIETKRKIILSGTPFQNNFEELQNTISLVREEFGSFLSPRESTRHGRKLTDKTRCLMDSNVDNDRRIVELKNKMKPFVHVHKGEILKKTLRGLFHSVLLLEPSDLQKICFQQLNMLKNGLNLDHLISIASVHPLILLSCEEKIPASVKNLLSGQRKHIRDGVKIKFLVYLIKLAVGEKVLVFSQYIDTLEFIGNLLKSLCRWTEGIELLYMDGQQDVKARQASIKHFNDPKSEARVLLASTKACCEGINLVGASRVVLLDVAWNPSVEKQAISRAYRLGQKKDVFVYHLITGTHEEDKYHRQVTKDRVSQKVFAFEEKLEKSVRMPAKISEDRILEEMRQREKIKNMFTNIVYEPKADEMIESFCPL